MTVYLRAMSSELGFIIVRRSSTGLNIRTKKLFGGRSKIWNTQLDQGRVNNVLTI